MKRNITVDKPLALLLSILVIGGALLFSSAAFGLLARGATNMSSVVFSHLVLGVGFGIAFLVGALFVDYHFWRRHAILLYVIALLLTLAVLIPHVGLAHGGARRWILIAGFSLQPSEFLKIACVILAAAYFSHIKGRVTSFAYGLGGLAGILLIPATLLILQPDLGTLGVICFSVGAIFFAAGAPWRHILLVCVVGLTAVALIAYTKPYVRDRIATFFNPAREQLGQAYQIRQSLIAIGSGGFSGRGFGQGIQKFTYLPEPMGDSIFAVAGEELGFIGAFGIVILFTAFAIRGYGLASNAPDLFGSLLCVGISTYLVSEAFINIAAMLGVIPLTGIPLTFISQGGSAMLTSLMSSGILLSVSKRHR